MFILLTSDRKPNAETELQQYPSVIVAKRGKQEVQENMWVWILAGVALLLAIVHGYQKAKWRNTANSLESCIIALLLDDRVRSDRREKLNGWVKDCQATNALALSVDAHIAIANWVANWAASGTLHQFAAAKLWEVKNGGGN